MDLCLMEKCRVLKSNINITNLPWNLGLIPWMKNHLGLYNKHSWPIFNLNMFLDLQRLMLLVCLLLRFMKSELTLSSP